MEALNNGNGDKKLNNNSMLLFLEIRVCSSRHRTERRKIPTDDGSTPAPSRIRTKTKGLI